MEFEAEIDFITLIEDTVFTYWAANGHLQNC